MIGIEHQFLKNPSSDIHIPHIHLHGSPLHAIICYINKRLQIRNVGVIRSIEIARDSRTFKELMGKWSNPY